jgi:DNA repair exonuclease SbcCD ATPase subunit
MIDWTICGHCNERVKCKYNGTEMVEHGCDIVQSLKKNFNSCLMSIQRIVEDTNHDFNSRLIALQHTNKELLDCDKSRGDTLTKALVKIYKLEERLKLVETDYVPTERYHALKKRIDAAIAIIDDVRRSKKTIADLNALDGTNPKGIVFNEYVGYDVDKIGKPIRVLYKFADGRLDTIEKKDAHHPSRQHLEKTLASKNQRIKELEHQLEQRNNEYQDVSNEAKSATQAYDNLLRSWQSLNRTVLELKMAEDKFKASPYGGGSYV